MPEPRHRFVIALPANNEQAVIGESITRLRQMNYPKDLFDIYVVADHCSDNTAEVARAAEAIVFERTLGPRGSKGAALRWLFEQVLPNQQCDAVVIFDADTHVSTDFLSIMDVRLAQGHQVIQGQHRIRNPEDGWVPALIWSTFIVDNRLQNLGRTALGCSAKNMGDSICFRVDVLRRFGWGEGLADDYAFRQQLLLEGVSIYYEPNAVGYGEAPLTWRAATTQRARWLRGTRAASRRFASKLLVEAFRRREMPLLEGGLQAILPSYSTLTVLTAVVWLASGLRSRLTNSWSMPLVALLLYPMLGLVLEGAPKRAYLAMLIGPVFVAWRAWLTLQTRLTQSDAAWVRTPRRSERAVSR
jgi:cellulose synthase/poly-beta-1,6-N-acetylglucosamine synthase-like glycosyltransferase